MKASNTLATALLAISVFGMFNGATAQEAASYPVYGRCVDARTGEPVSGCTVSLTGHMATGYPIGWGLPGWVDPDPITTGPDGRFRFDVSPPIAWDANAGYAPRFHLNVRHPDRNGWHADCNFPNLVELGEAALGDLPMILGSKPVLRVVDESGVPQRDVRVQARSEVEWFEAIDTEEPLRKWPILYQVGTTDSSGKLSWGGALPPGPWQLEVTNWRLVRAPTSRELPPAELPSPTWEVVVAPLSSPHFIEGIVVDADGMPAGRGVVEIAGGWVDGTPFRIAEDGTFRIVPPKTYDSQEDPLIRLRRNSRWDDPIEIGRIPWGTRGLTIEVPRSAELQVQVVDPNGDPVEAFGIHAVPVHDIAGLEAMRRAVRSADGSVGLAIREGEWRVLVVPADDRLAASSWIQVHTDAPFDRLAVRLDERIPAQIIVQDGNGRPVPGVHVRLFASRSTPFEGRMTTLGGALVADNDRVDVLLAQAATDAVGVVRLRGPARPGPAVLEIEGADIERTSVDVSRWDGRAIRARVASR